MHDHFDQSQQPNSAMNQSKFVAIPCNLLKARPEKIAPASGFPSHWLINWREVFKPIIKRSDCNRVIDQICIFSIGQELAYNGGLCGGIY